MSCSNNLKQLGIALHSYHDVANELPPGGVNGAANVESWGWGAIILPHLEQSALYDQLGVANRTLHAALVAGALPLAQTKLSAFVCPSDEDTNNGLMDGGPGGGVPNGRHFNGNAGVGTGRGQYVAKSNYVACAGFWDVDDTTNDGVMFRGSTGITIQGIQDGSSNTFFAGERNKFCGQGAWVGNRNPTGGGAQGHDYTLGVVSLQLNMPDNNSHRCVEGFASNHTGGANFLFGDGAVRFIRDSISFGHGTQYNNLISNHNGGGTPDNVIHNFPGLGVYERLGIRNDRQPVTLD